jgi:hypothetical protein
METIGERFERDRAVLLPLLRHRLTITGHSGADARLLLSPLGSEDILRLQ